MQFVYEQESLAAGPLGSGIDELRGILEQCRSNGRLIWAKAALPLYPRAVGVPATVTALSPSDDSVSRGIESLIEETTHAEITFPRRYRAPDQPNAASVAASVSDDACTMLLGADLEHANNPLAGWNAVLTHARPGTAASVVKVPHHGSEGAHSDEMWAEIVAKPCVAIVTPWSLAGRYLPRDEDLARLSEVADRVYLTAFPRFARARKDAAVEKMIRRVANVNLQTLKGWGQVRARRRADEDDWRLELAGDAEQIS